MGSVDSLRAERASARIGHCLFVDDTAVTRMRRLMRPLKNVLSV